MDSSPYAAANWIENALAITSPGDCASWRPQAEDPLHLRQDVLIWLTAYCKSVSTSSGIIAPSTDAEGWRTFYGA